MRCLILSLQLDKISRVYMLLPLAQLKIQNTSSIPGVLLPVLTQYHFPRGNHHSDLYLHGQFWPAIELHINRVIQYIFLFFWLLSVVTYVRFICFIAYAM